MRVQTPLVIFDSISKRQDVIHSFAFREDETSVQMLFDGQVYVKKYETQNNRHIWMTVVRSNDFECIVDRILQNVEGDGCVILFTCVAVTAAENVIINPGTAQFVRLLNLPPPAILRRVQISESSSSEEFNAAVQASLQSAEEERAARAAAAASPMKREWAAVIRERADDAQEGDYECCVCRDKAVSILFFGACSHCVVCDECARLIVEDGLLKKACPICRAPYENATPVRIVFSTPKKQKINIV
jgi:hypothetical protein